jgi:hypothetical protein
VVAASARFERGAARFGPPLLTTVRVREAADLVAAVLPAAGFLAGVFDLAPTALVPVVLAATLDFVPNVFNLTDGFALEAPAFEADFFAAGFFADVVRAGDLGFTARAVLADFGLLLRALVLVAGFFFAAPLDADVFLAGAFSGVVLFPEAELHGSAGHVIMGDTGMAS